MKKVLLASTALVAFAGAAAAEVTLSGWAEMGVVGGDGVETQFWNDVDVDFTMTGEADNGLSFGANVDLDSATGLGNTRGVIGDMTVFVSGEFGTVTMGDTDGALDWALTDAASWGNPGTIDDSETAHWGRQDTYLDGDYDGQILRYDYAYGDFGFAVSLETDDNYYEDDDDRANTGWAVGAKWEPEMGAGTLKLGIGYQYGENGRVSFGLTDAQISQLASDLTVQERQDLLDAGLITLNANGEANTINIPFGADASVWGVSAGYEMENGFSFGGSWSDWSSDQLDSGNFWGIGAGFAWDAFSISMNYGEHFFEGDNGGKFDASGFGLAMGYDMGGGLSILAGYGKSEADVRIDDARLDTDFDTYSLGLKMSF